MFSALSASSALAVLLALLFLALHLPYLPASLEDIDSINFALGLRHFDVAQHQPHPPGYPVFILLGRMAHALLPSEATALAVLSLVAATIGVVLIAALFRCLTGDARWWTGAAAALAIASPLYWFTAVRPLSDSVGLAAALAVHVMALSAVTDRAFATAAFCAGLAIGVRSQVMWLVVPLLSFVVVAQPFVAAPSGHSGRRYALSAIAFAAGVLVWFVPLLALSGGPGAYLNALSSQGGEDFAGVRMLWTNPTPRVLLETLYYAFIAPWAIWPVAIAVLAFAMVGALALLRRERGAALLLAAAFGPYLVFDLVFQESVTTRYALPLVVPVAFLAVRGLRVLPEPLAAVAVIGVAMFGAHLGGRSLAAYAAGPAPVFRMLDDMRAAAVSGTPVLAPDRRESFDLRRPRAWLGSDAPAFSRQLPSPPQHEWLEAVKYWNGGGREPVWFVVDPRRAAMDLVQHGAPAQYRWTVPYPELLGGTRPFDIDWYRVDRPDWYVGEGWSLTPEAAGVAERDRRGLEFGPISGWVRSAALDGGAIVVGGRSFDPAARPTLTVTAGKIWDRTFQLQPGAFVDVIRLPPAQLTSAPDYVQLTVSSTPPARIGLEQFDLSASRGVVAFGEGWHERELNTRLGQWRWVSDRGELRFATGSGPAVLHIEGESPRKYYSRGSRLVVRAGSTILADATFSDDFAIDVPVPAAVQPAMLTVETDQIHVPAERSWRGSADRRRLGLRIFSCELRSVSAPGTGASSPPGR